jgi:lipopolysaccharide/colanic/teichoic acid biosynthesis glycosyltransferase
MLISDSSRSQPGPDWTADSHPGRSASEGSFLDARCRALDLILVVPLLVLLSPVMLAVALIVKLDSPGPAVFRQKRYGRSMDTFTLHKFRTMARDASSEVHRAYVEAYIAGTQPQPTGEGPCFKLADDVRVTRVGHFLRKTSMDELPQLWNVLRGEMSLVGPRPALDYEVTWYQPEWFERFSVRPGMTGLWQVSGRSNLTHDEMIRLDLEYVRRRSLRSNLIILARTLPVVISARGTS